MRVYLVYLESKVDLEKMADLVCLVHLESKDVMDFLVTEDWMVYLDLQVRQWFWFGAFMQNWRCVG